MANNNNMLIISINNDISIDKWLNNEMTWNNK